MRKIAIAAAAMLAASISAHASCSFTAQSPPLPLTSGRFVFQSSNDALSVSHLYLYDFQTGLKSIIRSGWGLKAGFNPVLTPDGSGVLFSAIVTARDEFDLFYWKVGSSEVVNLTDSNDAHEEDVKLSADGAHIVWKTTDKARTASAIQRADFAVVHGVPQITNLQPLIVNPGLETSGPVYSPTRKYVYYFTGNGASQKLWRYDDATGNHDAIPVQNAGTAYYYPMAPDLYDLLYVSWPDPAARLDKIYVHSKIDDHGTAWNAADCAANNSDPAPVDEDHFIYSRTGNPDGGRYELYLGEISTGRSWSLDGLGVNGTSGNRLGASYARAAP